MANWEQDMKRIHIIPNGVYGSEYVCPFCKSCMFYSGEPVIKHDCPTSRGTVQVFVVNEMAFRNLAEYFSIERATIKKEGLP